MQNRVHITYPNYIVQRERFEYKGFTAKQMEKVARANAKEGGLAVELGSVSGPVGVRGEELYAREGLMALVLLAPEAGELLSDCCSE